MIDKSKNWENVLMSAQEKEEFINRENERILTEYPEEMERLFSSEDCELEYDFLGFLHVYATVDVPKDFTVIDLGCNQAVQAQYYKDCEKYIGVDSGVSNDIRFRQDNAEYYDCSIQEFINEKLPLLEKEGLDLTKTFAVCSYVPDEEAQRLVAETFPYNRVMYCDDLISENKPPVLNLLNCVKLLDECRDNGVIEVDPNDRDTILSYITDDNKNISDEAQELRYDGEGQRLLLAELAKAGVSFESGFYKGGEYKTEKVFDEAYFEEYLPSLKEQIQEEDKPKRKSNFMERD